MAQKRQRVGEEDQLHEVTLLKPHTHAGRQYQAGDTVMVTDTEREFLAHSSRGIIEATRQMKANEQALENPLPAGAVGGGMRDGGPGSSTTTHTTGRTGARR